MEKQLEPKLRFPEFKGDWKEVKYKDVYTFKTTNSLSRDNLNYEQGKVKNIHYGDIHTKFNTLFDINNENVPFINDEINISRIPDDCYLHEGDLVVADASEDYSDIGKMIEIYNLNGEKVLAGLHTFLARKYTDKIVTGFSSFLMKSWNVRYQIMRIAQGTKVLSLSNKRLAEIVLQIPERDEQQKITSFLTSIDERITLLTQQKEKLELYKKGIMQQLFSQEIRFKDDNGNDFPDWEEKKLGELLDYEQPTKYIVNDTEYNDSFDIPVLTAGKTFVLGYTNETENIFHNNLPVIIFDDFTTANKFVNFPFKVKSSAMKILHAKENVNIKYVYEAIQMIKFEIGGHGRHWISKYSNIYIDFPSEKEQQKIATFLSAIDKQIEQVGKQVDITTSFKNGLLQQLFV